MQYLLILSFFFLLTSVECRWFGQKPIDAAFERAKLMKYTKYRATNFVITSLYEEKLTGKHGIEYWSELVLSNTTGKLFQIVNHLLLKVTRISQIYLMESYMSVIWLSD